MRGRETLGTQRLYAVGAHVHDERVHERDVVSRARLGRRLQVRAQLGQERDGRARSYVGVELELELERQVVDVGVGDLGRRRVDVGDHVHLEIGRERIGQLHVARERRQHEIAQLDAVRRYDVAELCIN